MENKTNKRSASSPANKEDKKTKEDPATDVRLVCDKAANSDVFECSWCEGIQHTSCNNLSNEQCNAITNISSPNIVFFCTTCLRALPIALQQFDNQTHIVSNTESQINNHEKTILTAINRVHDKTSHKILDLTSKVSSMFALNSQLEEKVNLLIQSIDQGDQLLADTDSSHDKAPPINTKESLIQLAFAVISEQQEKERRQLNIVMHNIEESLSVSPQERKQHDIEKVTSIVDKYLAVKCSVKNAVRLGKRQQGIKPLLLKVTLASIQEKKSREELANLNKDGRKFMIKNRIIVQRGTR